MKTKLPLILGLAAIVAAIALTSCAELAGTTISFGPDGAATVTPPAAPIVIPAK